jgi:hypothetical protein
MAAARVTGHPPRSAHLGGTPGRRTQVKDMTTRNISRKSNLAFDPHPDQMNIILAPKEHMMAAPIGSNGLPRRRGAKPRTFRGPLHIQCNGHGDPKYLNQLVDEVLTWPHIESAPSVDDRQKTVSIRLKEIAASSDPSAFIIGREFARVLLKAPTIYLALPFEAAHWAVFRGWTEPHYLRSFGLMPVSASVLYTPRDEAELEVCYSLFSESYRFACKFADRAWSNGGFPNQDPRPQRFA